MLDGAAKVVFIPEILYNYRTNPMSVTQSVCYERYAVNFQVREYVLDFLRKREIFTKEDYYQYRAYAIGIVVDEIITIAGFDTSFQNKKRLFQILQSL